MNSKKLKESAINLYKSENFIYVRYVLAVFIILSTFPISAGFTKNLQNRDYENDDLNNFFKTGLSILLIRFITLIFMVLLALRVANVNKIFIASYAGLFLLALPAAMSSQISNYVSGLLLIAFDRIHLNDYVIVDDFEGRVTKLNLFSVEVQDLFTKKTRFIPNSSFWSSPFVNVSKHEKAVVKVEVTLASDNNFEESEKKILKIIDENFEGIDIETIKIRYQHSTWGVKLEIGCEVPSKSYYEYKMLLLKTLRKKLDSDSDIEYVK